MAQAQKHTQVIEPEKVIPAVVVERITLDLSVEEAEEIYSLVATTVAQNKTYNVYLALGEAFTGRLYGGHEPKHRVKQKPDGLLDLTLL